MTPDPPETDAVGVPPVDVSAFNDMVRSSRLVNVDQVRVFGERLLPGSSPSTKYRLNTSYGVPDDADRVAYRFDVEADLLGEDAEAIVARVEATVIVVYDLPNARRLSTNLLEFFGATSVPLVAHPFLREAVTSTASRLGYFGVLLPTTVHDPVGAEELSHPLP